VIDLSWLASEGPCKKFATGERIPCPGGPGPSDRAMYVLIAGRVDVFRASAAGGTQNVASLIPGDVFGGHEFFTDATGSTYTAGVDTIVYALTETSFSDLSWSKPDILFEVIKAAYLPLRKMTASQKAEISRAAQEAANAEAAAPAPKAAEAPPPAPKATEAPKPDAPAPKVAAAAPKPEAKQGDEAGENAIQTQPLPQIALPSGGGLYPEGHMSYVDVTKPEFQRLVFPKEYVCPLCKKTFSDYRVFRSKLYESMPMRFDLRKYFTDFQTEWYDVLSCHHCLFSTFHNYFTEPKPVQKVKFENNLATVRSLMHLDFSRERDIDFVFMVHYLAILCSDGYLSAGRQIKAKLWGNLSWLYEDVGDKEMEKYAANMAAEAYEEVYTQSHLTPVQEQITCLSIAGMQHRAGVDRNLKQLLFKAKTAQMGDKTYAKIAEDFMFELKAEDFG